ncbi:hypothetical protein DXB23_12770 [Dorea sp. OM02-2LB]|nr:hypothetical protein DXB23_12770 [Dorea sp. OM02-2LB]
MRTKQNVNIGIDGITCTLSGCYITKEIKYPENSKQYFIKITPERTSTKIAIVLPRVLRENNIIAYRASDTTKILDTIQGINQVLKKYLRRDWSDLYVDQLEVACTVDLGRIDEDSIYSLTQFMSMLFLEEKKPKKGGKNNAIKTKPVMKYCSGIPVKNCIYLKKEGVDSGETSILSNKRLKFKWYSKGAGSEFGGNTSIFRIEGVYCLRGIQHVMRNKDGYITLQDILKTDVIRKFIMQFKRDYIEIVEPRIKGCLEELEEIMYEQLHESTVYNSFLISEQYMFDFNIFLRALKKYYKEQDKTEGSYRKMKSVITKRMNEETIVIPCRMISVLDSISKEIHR